MLSSENLKKLKDRNIFEEIKIKSEIPQRATANWFLRWFAILPYHSQKIHTYTWSRNISKRALPISAYKLRTAWKSSPFLNQFLNQIEPETGELLGDNRRVHKSVGKKRNGLNAVFKPFLLGRGRRTRSGMGI